ncbi:very short patch repair endonuclease [Oricola nitratireducens]|uniref:very short patch repair endonuclease n=1 Tax=Oricola nitratireducens TaxID=2775868 RepID=UPI0031BB131D
MSFDRHLVDPARSAQMARVRGKDTKPEMVVRRLVHAMGYRYRLHRKDLPGKPDLVFPRLRKIIQVHGCFWHQHPDPACRRARIPKTRREFWVPKLEGNARRDIENERALQKLGWDVLVVWECETTPSRREELVWKLEEFLGS